MRALSSGNYSRSESTGDIFSEDSTYIKEKSAKGSLHMVFYVGNPDLVYEVYLRDKGGLGIGPSEITMEC